MSTADTARPTVWFAWLRDPVARNYLFVGLASLLIAAAALVFRHGNLLAALPVALAVLGLLLRSPVMPGLFLLVLNLAVLPLTAWLSVTAFSDVPGSHLRVMDLVLVAATLTYFACQFRLLSLTLQGMPSDVPAGLPGGKGDRAPKRPGSTAKPDETGRMFATVAVCVLIGQVVWLIVSELRLDFRETPPLLLARPAASYGGYRSDESMNRFLMLAGLTAVVTLPTALAFWYWRLSRLNPGEARLILLDTQWRESRRELNRQEKWRAWGLVRRRPQAARHSRPLPEERPAPTGPRRSFLEALALTCGMVFFGGIAAFVVVIVLLRYLGRT